MSNEIEQVSFDEAFQWANPIEWARYATSIECLREVASANGDVEKIARALAISGQPQYTEDPHAVEDLVRVASCVDFVRLDQLRKSGVLELDPPQSTGAEE
jgi:hypothetical protein